MTEKQAEEFNALFTLACDKMKGLITLGMYKPTTLNYFQKRRARKAIRLFEEVLNIDPNHWQSLFFLGKLYQSLKNHSEALSYFERSLQLEPLNHSIPQEASLAAMHLKDTDKAIRYSAESLRRNSGDVAVFGNHAMNLLIGGRDEEALQTINKALEIYPDDLTNQKIRRIIEAVINHQAARPTFEAMLR